MIGFVLILFGSVYILNQNDVSAHIPDASNFSTTSKDWKITFSKRMNPDTFTSHSVKVTNQKNEAVPVSFQWNKDHTILTLVAPEGGYTLDETYEIFISKDVESINGKPLKKSYQHTFTAFNELPTIKDKEQLTQLLNERRKLIQSVAVEQESSSSDSANADMAAHESGEDSRSTSATNVQVEGIDEGDIIKSDGQFIYFSRHTDIIIAEADHAKSNVVSSIQEEAFHPTELYVHKDVLVSIGYSYDPLREEEIESKSNQHDVASLHPFHSQTSVFLYDISDRSNPKQIREVVIEGNLNASRKMDGYLYLVLNHYPPYHILEESHIDPRPYIKDSMLEDESKPIEFDNMYFFPDSKDEHFLILASVDLNELEKEVSIESYLGASHQLYMSKNNMYIAVNHYRNEPSDQHTNDMIVQSQDTKLYQFGVNEGKFTFHQSVIVNGTLINQFAMDERHDTFRVATTKGNVWHNKNPSTNNIYIFDLDLNPLGSVEGLAKGERIYSVRFMDDVAYMVTFKQVDPLFVVGLEDPTNPTVLGELKIPGFSNYLHPLDDNHVIGFGQHTELMSSGTSHEPVVRLNGLKISVFDVGDPANPIEKFSDIIGKGHSHSEINNNHKALYQHPTDNIFGFQAVLYDTKTVTRGDATYQEDFFAYEGAFLYEITADKGIILKDTITHQDSISNKPYFDWWPSRVVRMVSVGDTLYTLSHDKMKVYDLIEGEEIQTVELPEMDVVY